MQTRFIAVSLAVLAFSESLALSQETRPATNAPARRAERPAPTSSPELLPDGSVKFRLRATNATDVKVTGQFGRDTAMTRDERGVWSVTVPNVPPGVHEYRFVVDGLSVIDPNNPAIKPQRWPNTSILHVPANPLGGPATERVDVAGLAVLIEECDLMVCLWLGADDLACCLCRHRAEPADVTRLAVAFQSGQWHLDVDEPSTTP